MNELLEKFNEYNDISNTMVSAKFLISKIKKESQLTENIQKRIC